MTNSAIPDGTVWQLLGYQPAADAYDEARLPTGQLREHWRLLVENLQAMGKAELDRRWKQGLAQMNRDGVTFNPFDGDEGASRPWMMDPIPMVFQESEWNWLADGIAQRHRLFEALLEDLHGAQRLLKERIIPAELYYGHPGAHPAYHGLVGDDRRHLNLFACDLARMPDGQWVVTGDRTRAPFGLGYVLENRFVSSQFFPKVFRQGKIRRIASFYANLRKSLITLAYRNRDNPRVVLLTSGPSSRSYFEDAYLARYLGFILAEGGDLAVRGNRVSLKTLGGLLPVEVVFRRIDDELCDPVELPVASAYGVAGLIESCRAKNVAVANSIGCRIVESPAFLPWLPDICQYLLSEPLKLPSVQSLWLGSPEGLKAFRQEYDQLIIRRAHRTDTGESPIHVGMLDGAQRARLFAEIESNPSGYVAQQSVVRSRVPVWLEERVEPWHLAVRAFSTIRENAVMVLPGGLARISADPIRLDGTMTAGERSQDIWVLSDSPAKDIRLTPLYGPQIPLRRSSPDLPSRVADNMFWLGRYIARAEGSVRLLRELFQLMSNESDRSEPIKLLMRTLVDFGQMDPDYVIKELGQQLPNIETVLPQAMLDIQRDRSLRSSIRSAMRLVASVPDRINPDMSRVVRKLEQSIQAWTTNQTPTIPQSLALLDELLPSIMAFEGLAAECMTRGFGWLFLDLGLRLEQAWNITLLLDATANQPAHDDPVVWETVLQVSASLMTYRSRYLSNVQIAPILDLLVCDETNPRSIAYQLLKAQDHIQQLPKPDQYGVRSDEQLIIAALTSAVHLADVHELSRQRSGQRRLELDRLLTKLREHLPKLGDLVSSRYLIHAGLPRTFTGIDV
jgi:uncharacterized circularly permuted ATP-grasp superfamily protein/uncharacterized alpha-E superfamily protein